MPVGTPTKVKKRKKSVLKRARQALRRAAVNRANRTRVRTMIKRMRAALGAGDATAAGNLLRPTLAAIDRKSTRLNSSHGYISYAVFCLKKKKHSTHQRNKTKVHDQT